MTRPRSRSGHASDRQQYRRRAYPVSTAGPDPSDERIASVSGDGAYDTKDSHEAIALGAAHAISPTRKNAKPGKTNRSGSDARKDISHTTPRLGRAIWKDGAATTGAVLSEPKVVVSNCWANASGHVTSTVRSLSRKCGLPC